VKALSLGLVVVSLLAVVLKLFTYEYFFADDPTCGVALRAQPGLDNRRQFQSDDDLGGDVILVSDENDFPGGGAYRFIVSGGWLGLAVLTSGVLVATRRRGAR
jgi:hypothetical protein